MTRFHMLMISLMLTFQLPAQWTEVQTGTGQNLRAIHFATNDVGYTVGEHGVILNTNDQGDTWQVIFSDSAYSWQSVHFTSKDTGYVAGTNLMKTTDGGQTWTELIIDSAYPFTEVYFVNSTLGFASARHLYRTLDAGATWDTFKLNSSFSSIYFPSDSVGYFIGGTSTGDALYRTETGGGSYLPITNGFQSIKEATFFLNDTTGYMCGWYGGLLAKTTDGGTTWDQFDDFGFQCWDVHFMDENTGYYINNAGGKVNIWNTTDGGNTWTVQLDANNHLYEMEFIDEHTGFAVGYYGTIYKTSNGGGIVGLENEPDRLQLSVYPNPAEDFVHLKFDTLNSGEYSITIISLQGRKIRTVSTTKQNTVLDVSSLPAGVYLLTIEDKDGNKDIRKLVKE